MGENEIVWGADRTYHSGIDRGVIYPFDGPAVPWNGLVSVDEEGGQERSTYYQDGRKYLTVVTPREYKAKITAYTFPDKLAELCGVAEVADGLFLDEQSSGQFNLSYRVMLNGGPHYRIHLIYGITAMLDGAQFQTHSDDTTPSDFVFDLDAIPQELEGYRPTAHVMIDTTNLDPALVNDIESRLYGRGESAASIPSLPTLYDMMSFGDTIIIRDPGDGTFTIEGSYKNVKSFSDGSFEVTNLQDDQVVLNPGGQNGYYDLTVTP